MIVLDAAVLANVVADDAEDGVGVRAVLAEEGAASIPDLANIECLAVLRKRWTAGVLTDERFSAAVDDLADLPVDRYPTLALTRRAFELRENVAVYDACYVALAEALGAELITTDGRLARATGCRCPIRFMSTSK